MNDVVDWLTGIAQRVVISGAESDWKSVTNSDPQRLVLCLDLFNIFISAWLKGVLSQQVC